MSYGVSDFGTMISDRERVEAHLAFLDRHVAGKRVLDLGCGTGFFTLAALERGASEVVAVDLLDAVRLLPAVLRANGYSNRCQVWQGDIRKIDIGKVDIVLSDLRGPTPFFGDAFNVVGHAQGLLRAGGRALPGHDTMRAALVSLPDWYAKRITPWNDDSHDWQAVVSHILQTPVRLSSVGSDAVIGDPVTWERIDFSAASLAEQRRFGAPVVTTVDRDAVAHGVLVWFDTTLCDGVGYSNAPGDRQPTYGRLLLPLPDPFPVCASDAVELDIRVHRVSTQWEWTWACRTGDRIGKGSTLDARPMLPLTLMKQAALGSPLRIL